MKHELIFTEDSEIEISLEEKLSDLFDLKYGPFTRNELISNVKTCSGVFVKLKHNIDKEVIDSAEKLKFIATPTTGLNHIDIEYANKKNIKIISLKDESELLNNITSTAELTWGLILSLTRYLHTAYQHVKEGHWDRNQFFGIELQGLKLGIIGHGRIGKMIAYYAKAFRMNTIICDTDASIKNKTVSLVEICKSVDVITIHIPSCKGNNNLIGTKEFKNMKNSAILINTSRGDVIDERALLTALENNQISGAALDVLRKEYEETDSSEKLIEYARHNNNLIITPHIGGATYTAVDKTSNFIADKIINYIKS